jgi:dihydroorotase
MTQELLQQVRVLDPVSRTDRVADVLLLDGIIHTIEENLTDWPTETQIRDCRGLVLGPGLVDLYSHSGEPGFEERETLVSLSEAAIAGGFTRLHLLPNTQPALDQATTVEWLCTACCQLYDRQSLTPNIQAWGALTLGTQGEHMTELAELAASGVIGFTDSRAISNPGLLRRLLEYLKPLGKPVALWPCDPKLAGSGVMREGADSLRLGLPGIPAIAETAAIANVLEIVEATGTSVHLMRISTARSVELIRAAKDRNLPVTASTTWMHILLNSEAVYSYDPSLHLDSPLGLPADQQALQAGLRDGTLDAIAIDHSPYTYEEKTVAFAESPPGAIGLELALALLWKTLVASELWSALELWQCLSCQPAQCLGQTPARLQPGQPAEMTLFDPLKTWTVSRQVLKSQSANTPWLGARIVGQVLQTWCTASRTISARER